MKQIVSTYKNVTDLQQSLAYWNEKGYRLTNIFWASKMNVVGSGYNTSTYSDYSIVVVYDKVEEDKSE